jgi:hypothetical protein
MKLPRRAKNQVNEFHPRWTARHFHSRSALRPCGLCMPFSKLDYRYLCPFRRACILRNLGVPDYHITIGGRIKVRQYSLSRFYLRRTFRIFPVAYLYLLAMTPFVAMAAWKWVVVWLYGSTYVQDLPWNLSHLWSLSVEEQFYLVWPVAIVARYPDRRCSAVCSREKI